MALKLCVLASGSKGNCIYVESDRARFLIDAGLSARELDRRLTDIGRSLTDVLAVCVTHEHVDHVAGLGVLHRRTAAGLYTNGGTRDALEQNVKTRGLPWRIFTTGSAFDIEDVRVDPFPVPHDSFEPVGFILTCGNARAGIVTDMGMTTELIRARLRDCAALVLEFNHDEQMLRDSQRPWPLKQRIAGRHGHLSNHQAAETLAEIAGPNLRAVLLAHLSSECNRPELALRAADEALKRRSLEGIQLIMTFPDKKSEMVLIE